MTLMSTVEGSKKLWEQLQQKLGSRMKTLEVLAVLEGEKSVARILCREEDVCATRTLLMAQGLSLSSANFKVVLERPSASAFADKASRAPFHDPARGSWIFYASKEMSQALQAKKYEENQDHASLGMLLGYPPCCTAFFQNHFSPEHADLTLDILDASEGFEFPFFTNIVARHVDASLLSHFPHSFSCEPSIAYAKRMLEIARTYAQEDVFYLCMQTAVVYTPKEGIFFLQHPIKSSNVISYSGVTGTVQGKLYYLLNEEKRITAIDKHSFQAGEHLIGGKDFGVMLFS